MFSLTGRFWQEWRISLDHVIFLSREQTGCGCSGREAAGHFGDYDITIQLIPTQPGLSSQVCVVGVQQQLRPGALLQLHPLAGTLARVRVSVLNTHNVTNPTLALADT